MFALRCNLTALDEPSMDTIPKTPLFILNWPALDKCILMLGLGILIQTVWLIWKLFIYLNPTLWVYVDTEYLKNFLLLNSAMPPLLAGVILLCWYLRKSKKAQLILPYVSIFAYGLSMIHESFLVGIMSPASSITLVLSVMIGLLLFERVLVYSTITVIVILFTAIMYATTKGMLPYAPIFIKTIDASSGKATVFWVFSMLCFGLPILIGGFILIEMLLSQWRQREKKIELLSQIDPLTGLYNRRTLYGFLLNLLDKKHNKPALHSLILLDLDFFKKINDSCGHVMGDKVLIEAARVLKATVREKDIVGRFGGEEFIIILVNTSYKQTSQVAERCRKELNNLVMYDDYQNKLLVTASFGVTHFDAKTHDIDTILKEADQALYHAKDLGRNQVVHYWDYAEQQV